jgi:lipopolysaccharide export system permease protein
MPYIASLITPITIFIATIFVTSKLAGHSEIIAMLSSGVSFERLMIPYLIGSLLIASLSFYLNGWVIPNANKDRIAFEIKYVKSPFTYSERDIHLKIAPETYAYMESYNNHSNVGYRFTLERIENNQLQEKLSARRIEWDSANASWKLKTWKLHTFDGFEESFTSGMEMDTALAIYPKDFSSTHGLYETMTTPELDQHITELRSRGATDIPIYQVEKYIRFMAPFSAIILTLIGLIMSARKRRGGSSFQIALGFLLAFIYIIFFIFAKSIAEVNSMNPILAVWIPNIVFTGIGVLLYKTVPR